MPRLRQNIINGHVMTHIMQVRKVTRNDLHVNTMRISIRLASSCRRKYQCILRVFILSEMAVFPRAPLKNINIGPLRKSPPPLVRNTVGHELELVVDARRVARVALADQLLHEVGRLPLGLVQDEALLEVLHALGLEAG